ncbi:gliding motility-associated C-terminal domain-containing protein [Segetibacter koreensis]|uniref:gliding motility-associated C-terminal domain-containing protein n=1 Tax=Segetibacter koreensis TaxID=398037 RepID=UPI00036A6947|nr:T9SS C-terminal target domain-containing protein [Segetibacter koreensis]
MRPNILITIAIAFFFSIKSAYCQYANIEFIENKGQWNENVKFKGVMNNGAFFLTEKGFRVLQSKAEDLEKMSDFFHGFSHVSAHNIAAKSVIPPKDEDGITVHSHAYNVEFINAQTPAIVGDKPLNTYNNYIIGNDPSKWKGNCRIYQAITYQNIYPGIDIRYYTNDGKLKYDIVVHAGADLSHLAMKYDGVDGLQVKNEQLVIKTSVGETRELAPYAYQVVAGVKKEVGCRFKVAGKTVQFAVNNYSKSSELIIDPTLVFSTFTGSTADNWGYTATYGPDGSFYAGGIVFDQGFPTSPGAFSTSFNGGIDDEGIGPYDIGIIKFSPNGSDRTYATYIGGSGNEQPHSLVVDGQGELVLAGRSNSPNFPTTVTDNGGGGYDIIVTKLNAAGSALVGSRKIGGKESDGVNIRPKYPQSPVTSIRRNYGDDARGEVILDNDGNIILASNTQSALFPTTGGAFQKTSGGKQDGVLIKLTSNLSNILFSTLIGGSGNDAAFVLAINPTDNNIYVGGNTDGADFPGNKTNALHPAYQGGETDGFVSIVSPDGGALLKTTFIGTADIDMLYGIQFDKFGFPYIMGTTTSDTWPIVNAAFSQSKGKQFIAKLKPDLSAYEYSTVFGSGAKTPNISPIAFLVDRCENVYVSGWGGTTNSDMNYPNAGTSGLSVTPDAIQSKTDNSDFYFFVLERNAAGQLYGSFFGQVGGLGEHVDGGTSRFDRNGVIYQALCANCGRDVPFPTTPGVWSPSNGSTRCNLAAVKIAFNLAGVASSVRASINGVISDTSGCVPLTVDFTDTLASAKKYVWNFGDGSADVATADPTISHTFNAAGTYQVKLISIDSSKCNIADSAYTHIKVRSDKVNLGFASQKLLPCESANYQFTNTSLINTPGRNFTNTSFTWYFGDSTPPVTAGLNLVTHAFPGPGVYKVKLVLTDTSFCNAPDSVEIPLRIATNVKAQFETPPGGCAPYNAVFDNISAGGQQFFWAFGDGETSTEASPTHVYTVPGTYSITLRAVDSGTCNMMDTTGMTIVVSDKPTASYTFTPNPPQENTAVNFSNNSIGATHYVWKFGDGDSLNARSQEPVSHIYNETGTFNTCLVALNNFGCPDTTCQHIVARITPLIDVPNAFTPNGDGINDKVFVRGFAISKMTWRIYNRWGQMVFETNDKTQGWDGTFKGSIQPKEVYHYSLAVQFSDNSKYEKKGDITLLR